MQPRERVLTALNRRQPDRAPFFLRFTPPVVEELRRRTGATDPAAYFDTDVRDVPIAPSEHRGDYSAYLAGKPAGTQANEDGIGEIKGAFQHYVQIVPLLDTEASLKTIETYPLPDIAAPYRYIGFTAAVQDLQARGYAVRGRAGSLFEWTWQVRGFERLFSDFSDNPELAECLLDRRTETLCRAARMQVEAGVDVLGIHDDIAMQTGPMMSPATWRTWFKPRWGKVLAEARSVRPDILVWYHTDGDAAAYVPDLIDIGVNVLNPVQPECMDGAAIKRQYGDRLAFWGGLGTQTTLPFGTPSDVRAEVKRLVSTLGACGGLLLEPTHQVQPDVPWENIVAYVEAARSSIY